MPRYFFNVHDGTNLADTEGTLLAGLEEARREAIRYSGELLVEHGNQFWDGSDWHMDVTDESGLVLFALHFLAVDSPSTSKGSGARPVAVSDPSRSRPG